MMFISEPQLVKEIRATNPQSRIQGMIKLVRNGGSTKQYGCAHCGAQGPTFCARYPETKLSATWRWTHRDECLAIENAKRASAEFVVSLEVALHVLAGMR